MNATKILISTVDFLNESLNVLSLIISRRYRIASAVFSVMAVNELCININITDKS